MSKLSVYRADKRTFAAGDFIGTAAHFTTLNPDGLRLEEVFTAAKLASKPARADCLFVFESFPDAEWHWAKMADAILYECEIDDGMILHRGDMRLVDSAGEALRANTDATPQAVRYWEGQNGGNPIWELLVARAMVTRVICADQKLRRLRIQGYRLPSPPAAPPIPID
jgi:hypothetical protein